MAPRRGGKNCWPFNAAAYATCKEQFYTADQFSPCQDPLVPASIIRGNLTNGNSVSLVRFPLAVDTAASIFLANNDNQWSNPFSPTIITLYGFGDFAAGVGVGPSFNLGYTNIDFNTSVQPAINWIVNAFQTAIAAADNMRVMVLSIPMLQFDSHVLTIKRTAATDGYAGNFFLFGMQYLSYGAILPYP